MSWYISRQGQKEGPFSDDEVHALIAAAELKADDLVWNLALSVWTPAARVPGLFNQQKSAEPQGATPRGSLFAKGRSKSPITAAPAQASQRDGSATSRQSYIKRHWRGELPLPVSYWLNGLIAGLILTALMYVIPWNDLLSDAPLQFLAALFFVLLFEWAATAWQAVGIWRSANRYVAAGSPKRWSTLAKVMVVIGILGTTTRFIVSGLPQAVEYTRIATGNDPFGKYQVRVIRDGTEIEIAGHIGFGLAKKLNETLNANPKVRVIHINSPGGRVIEARKLRDVIAERHLSTYTATGCFSACTLAYAAGERRLIARSASLGFHQYAFPGVSQVAFRREYEQDKRDWAQRGFGRKFIDRAFLTPHSDLWRPSHEELFEAKVITGYPRSTEVAVSGVAFKDVSLLDAELTKVPLFAALKSHERDTYKMVLAEFHDGVSSGKSVADLRKSIFPLAQSVFRKRLPYASNAALLNFVDVVTEQIRVLKTVNPDRCYEFLHPDSPNAAVDTARYFTASLAEKEALVMAEVVRTAAPADHKLPSKEQVQPYLKNLFARLAERHGDRVKLLLNPLEGAQAKAETCSLNLELYQAIRRLPENEAGPILRFMIASAS